MATWKLDPGHSSINFSVKHLMVAKVRGAFDKFDGEMQLDVQAPTAARVHITIDAGSINTREPTRDGHLKSPDFFDAANHPTVTFQSSKVVSAGGGLQVHGDLTVRGVSKPVVLQAEFAAQEIKDMQGRTRVAASATTQINRKDFGLSWNKALETGGVVVGEEVQISIEAEFIKQA